MPPVAGRLDGKRRILGQVSDMIRAKGDLS
jgi:hypothetical protein